MVGTDACVDCAYEEDCDDCDDPETPLLVGLIIVFKDLPLLKCMHKQEFFPIKSLLKTVVNFQKTVFTRKDRKIFEKQKLLSKFAQTGSHWVSQFVYRCFW